MISLVQIKPISLYSTSLNKKSYSKSEPIRSSYPEIGLNYPSGIYFGARIKKLPLDKPSKKTMQYLERMKQNRPSSLCQLDMEKIQDICAGIDVFKGWSASDFKIFTENFAGIELQRGCIHKCGHCGACSPAKIQTMKFGNFEKFIDGIATVKNRLGFDPLPFDEYNLFSSSDPMIYASVDNEGNPKNFYDASMLFYNKLGKKTYITTAGWHSKFSQQAAEKFAQNPDSINSFSISVSTFHDFMTRSYAAKRKGKDKEAKYWRDKYINMMGNALKTACNIKVRKGIILSQYNPQPSDTYIKSYMSDKFNAVDHGPAASQKLLRDILKTLEQDGVDISHWAHKNYSFKSVVELRGVSPLGRASKKYIPAVEDTNNNRIITMQQAKKDLSYIFVAPGGKIWRSNYYKIYASRSSVQEPGNVYLEKSLNFE